MSRAAKLTRRGVIAGVTMLPVAAWADGLIFRRGGSGAGAAITGTVAVTEHATDRIFQRVGTAKTITFAGTYTGNPDAIQVKVTDDTGASTIIDWTTLGSPSIAGGAWSGTLSVPQGAWYKFQARFNGNHAVTASASNKFGVGMLVALLGQSNMYHTWTNRSFPPAGDAKARRYVADAWRALDASAAGTEGSVINGGGVLGGNASVVFGNTLRTLLVAAGQDIPVGLLEYAQSGVASISWLSGQACWTVFVDPTTGVNAPAVGGDFEHVVWQQGESDSSTVVAKATYKSHMDSILSQCWAQTGRNASTMKFGVVPLGSLGGGWGTDSSSEAIRTAHLEWIASNISNGVYYSATILDAVHGADQAHMPLASLVRVVKRYAQSVANSLGYAALSGAGPFISGATFSNGSADVTVAITQAGGTALLDGTGSSAGTGLIGFRVLVNSSPATISSTVIAGGTVVLTLSAPLATGNTVSVEYGYGVNPYSWVYDGVSDTDDHVLYDDQSALVSDTTGLPLRPSGPITASLV